MRRLPFSTAVFAALLVATAAPAAVHVGGRGPGHVSRVHSAGVAPAVYVPNMVWFTREVSLQLPSMSDSPRGILHLVLRGVAGSCTNQIEAPLNGKVIAGNKISGFTSAETAPGAGFIVDNSTCPGSTTRVNLSGAAVDNASNKNAEASYGVNTTVPGVVSGAAEVWDVAWDVTESGAHRGFVMKNGVVVSAIDQVGTWSSNLSVTLSATPFYLNYQGDGTLNAQMELGDFYFDAPSASPVDAANNPTYDVTKFTTAAGAPVDLGVSCRPLGVTPLDCFTGPASTWLLNKGSAGNPTSVGANSLITAPFDGSAPGPGGIAAEPFLLWLTNSPLTTCPLSAGTCNTNANTNQGAPIALGELIEEEVITSIFAPPGTAVHPMSVSQGSQGGSNPWTLVQRQSCSCGGAPMQYAVYQKVAEASDVTAPGQDWLNHPVINWTVGNSDGFYGSIEVRTLVFRKSDGSTPQIDASAISGPSGNAAASGWPCPSVTPTAAHTRYTCAIAQYDQSFEGGMELTAPSGSALRDKLLKGVSGNRSSWMDEKIAGTSAISRTFSASQNPANATVSFAQVLK